jgi:acetylornithine deacetylase/succinyl-diaminopimelate desuccinylase-like protein
MRGSFDWKAVRDETVMYLQRLIQFRTVNPPGDELAIAQYLRDVLEREGISVTLLQPSETRAAVIGTLKGTGEKPPVMLVAHTDVVGVEESQWTAPPFGGEIRDGYLYGRGAIDDKGMLAVNLMTMLLLARQLRETGATLVRDVIFLAPPDEETGGKDGMGWLAEHHADKLQAEYAINEGGRIRIGADGNKTLLLQVAEKVSHIVKLSAHGHAGHAGVPRADNAILRIGRALAKISAYASDPQHGVSPTILSGGSKYNVLPSEASVIINVRTRPNESIDDIVAHLVRLIDDPEVTVEIAERGEGAPASPEDSEMYNAIAAAARHLDPKITVTPYLSNGVTDSARLRRLGVKAYGILPFPLTAEDEGRMHGHDERVSLEGLEFGTRLIFDAITQLAWPSSRL